ncbi:MAG: restriction endonuclease subunit S, partial [Myxococcota bacterium]|nr:restriction endonuclease subunit S [Myxococcota bacterium]
MMRCSKSGVEKIPKDWCAVQLQDIATIVPGGRLNLTKNEHYQKEGFVAFSAAGPDGFVALQEFSGEAVVLSSIGARCGKAFFADGAWTTLANTYVIQADEQRYSNRFLWYLVNDEDYWHRSGTAQPFISPHDIRHAWVPSPSLQEQHKILDVLDGVSQTVANYQKQAEWLRRTKKGFLETLRAGAFFSKKPDRERLKGLTKVTMGETLISHQLTGTGIPVFSADTKEKPWGYTDNTKRRYPKGTIVVSARGSIGFPRLPKFETYTSTQTTLIVYPCERV